MFPRELQENFTALAHTLAAILEDPNTPRTIKDAITAFDCDLHAALPPTVSTKVLAAEIRAGLPLSLSAITEHSETDERFSP